ncbi:glycosyltransferase family 2 protein [Acholeplasma hippikon]|uniref:dTDP-Rha:alpha-D-GlcNAc-pyrophosphate polyprenol, alpha-3-L-rhamnosyltransferase n=1 Tax=Acholeplasma hippikon TaxID=264636 RepID=A0A449BLH1_9MOLU|nr:glycosyltransferase family 2 protein [Acholeplasma hippikon]VEU83285.1 dTDP-Rha:alpha-D-GlcNAc-pyrophosphate polyprenol, alpha-3-L-rhamnosyltransferase [Acholeplasma hippikon]
MKKPLLISYIIVNYNTYTYTSECVNSIINNKSNEYNYEIIIVDNGSTDNSYELLRQEFRLNCSVQFIKSNQNIGFGRANNLAVENSNGEILIFTNSDTNLLNTDVRLVVEKFRRIKNVGQLGVKILNTDLSIQTIGFKKPSLINDFKLNFLFWNFNFVKKIRFKSRKNKGLIKVDWVSGAFFIMYKHVFIKIGGFDPNIFMYSEDLDLSTRLIKQGYNNYVFDEVTVVHHHGKSSTFSLKKKIKEKKNYLYVLKKNRISFFPNMIFLMHIIHIYILYIVKKMVNLFRGDK